MRAAAAAGLPAITIALCGNRRKHDQSFDGLRAEAEDHNRRLLHWSQQRGDSGNTQAPSSEEPTAISASSTFTVGIDKDDVASPDAPAAPPRVFFRLVNLNYDPIQKAMAISPHDAIKGIMLRKSNGVYYDPIDNKSENSTGSATAATGSASACESVRRGYDAGGPHMCYEVDVVLHKVASFAAPAAARALAEWVASRRAMRAKQNALYYHNGGSGSGSGGGSPPAVIPLPAQLTANLAWPRPQLVLVDAIGRVDLLTRRCALYELLDGGRGEGPVALIPRTYRVSAASSPTSVVTPIGRNSAVADAANAATALSERRRTLANGPAGERWWIAKPDEGTGPSFTHHMVMWRTRGGSNNSSSVWRPPHIPAVVTASLPREATAFVLQEYYLYSLPVVLKVYVIGGSVFVKASPTVKLLAMIEEQVAVSAAAGVDKNRDEEEEVVPVFMDSQNKDLFTSTGLHTASSTTTSAVFSPQASAAAHTPEGPPSTGASATTRQSSGGGHSLGGGSEEGHIGGGGDTHSPLQRPLLSRSVAAAECWDAFLSPGAPAHRHLCRLAAALSASDGGLGLSLYGFDVVLLPRALTHDSQRAACPVGFGRSENEEEEVHHKKEEGNGDTTEPAAIAPGTVFAYTPEDMFSLETGAATPLLLDSVPVVIDVNYFPGYKGMPGAAASILRLLLDTLTTAAVSATEGDDYSVDGEGQQRDTAALTPQCVHPRPILRCGNEPRYSKTKCVFC